jgi:ATP-dependent Lhr-like helicase
MYTEQIRTIRHLLKYTWTPFFARFGKLTPIQIETIPKVLEGANVIVASPTATGKTEAVVAPVAERFLSEQWRGLAILYIVPTRALANDTLARIEGPLRDTGITTALKHGDKPYLSTKNLPNFLITTPESLDSLICRHPKVFSTLQTVILDEIHLLDNTYRGDQLRLLLWRLKKLATNKNFSIHLLSATLSEPSQVAQRYVNKFEVIKVGEERRIDYHLLGSFEEAYRLAKKQGWKKLLCFCNMRESVEMVSAELARLWHPYPVVAHHGSLSRRVREEAETVMKESDVAVCVATSTLEVGIDIGDIDLVVLAEVPWSISSLLQRIGRGNRRKGLIHTVAIVSTNEEKGLMEAMFKVATSGSLPIEPYEPDKSVAVQQIFSYLYQNTQGTDETTLLELLSPLCSDIEVKLILGHLRAKGWVEYQPHKWFASTKLMDYGEKGRIHSNIPDDKSYRVIDIDSGKEIGIIAGVFDEAFALAGKVWRVVSVYNDTVKVRRLSGRAESALFNRRRNVGAFYYLLPPKLRDDIYL